MNFKKKIDCEYLHTLNAGGYNLELLFIQFLIPHWTLRFDLKQ